MREIDRLAAFLRERLEADEHYARQLQGEAWALVGTVDGPNLCMGSERVLFTEAAGTQAWARAAHAATYAPARVLNEVAMKRSLLDTVLGWRHGRDECSNPCGAGSLPDRCPCECVRDNQVLGVLNHLMQPYQDTI